MRRVDRVAGGTVMRVPLVFDYQGSLTREMLDHGFLRPTGRREWAFMRLGGSFPTALQPFSPVQCVRVTIWWGRLVFRPIRSIHCPIVSISADLIRRNSPCTEGTIAPRLEHPARCAGRRLFGPARRLSGYASSRGSGCHSQATR